MLSNGHADLVSGKDRAFSAVELQETATIRLTKRRVLPVHCFPTLVRSSPTLDRRRIAFLHRKCARFRAGTGRWKKWAAADPCWHFDSVFLLVTGTPES